AAEHGQTTLHSAQADALPQVMLLSVADPSSPSDYGRLMHVLLEEERRLLYVAMTRARDELHLVAPLRYYVTQQSRGGDAHVYGARSRFLTDAVMATLEPAFWPETLREADAAPAPAAARVDVGAALRGMWD
ncbi:MAG: 3'-5' exonuclease, partial [Pseudomonadota bacterium]